MSSELPKLTEIEHEMIKFMITMQNLRSRVVFFHLTKQDYAAHKITEKLYETLGDYLDKFMETLQGKHGDIPSKAELHFGTVTGFADKGELKKELKKTAAKLQEMKQTKVFDCISASIDNLCEDLYVTIKLLRMK
jgi:hypothetical protein